MIEYNEKSMLEIEYFVHYPTSIFPGDEADSTEFEIEY